MGDLATVAYYAYQSDVTTTLISMVFTLILLGVALLFFSWFMNWMVPRSMRSRKLMTDLYVIGMIRKFAAKDGVNIEDEMKGLRQIEKWEKASRKDLDQVIETELNEKVSAEMQKQIDEINKSSASTKK